MTREQVDELLERIGQEALATIAQTGASEAARVAAAKYLVDRNRGKPATARPKDPEQGDLLLDDGWGTLLDAPKPAPRTN